MAEGLGGVVGGILGLLTLLDEHREAIDFDLLNVGLSVDDVPGGLPWDRFRTFVRWLPQGSALYRSVRGDESHWGLQEQLLAAAVDAVRNLTWVMGGGKGKRPEPIRRPGVGPQKVAHFGKTVMSIEEARAWLDQRKGG